MLQKVPFFLNIAYMYISKQKKIRTRGNISCRDATSLHHPDLRLTALIMTTLERQTHTKDLVCSGKAGGRKANNNYHAVVSLVYLVAKSRCTPATEAGREDNIIINCYCLTRDYRETKRENGEILRAAILAGRFLSRSSLGDPHFRSCI